MTTNLQTFNYTCTSASYEIYEDNCRWCTQTSVLYTVEVTLRDPHVRSGLLTVCNIRPTAIDNFRIPLSRNVVINHFLFRKSLNQTICYDRGWRDCPKLTTHVSSSVNFLMVLIALVKRKMYAAFVKSWFHGMMEEFLRFRFQLERGGGIGYIS